MSGAHHEAINVSDAGIGDDQYPPPSAPNQASQGMSSFFDGSGPIFSMYLERVTEEDKNMAESWKADAEGILVFTGLFSAAVASLISVSIQDIRPNPQDTSNFYLANIYQTLTDPNRSNIPDSLPSSPPPFSPPHAAVWVNGLWFLSLVISITCALLATLLQQWARRYLKVTQPRYSPHKRARIRAFFFEGVEKYLLSLVVEALPTLLHVSLFLFFSGLSVFLCNVNLTIFKLALSWIGVCAVLYGCVTFMPIFYHDSPYYTPLSILVWQIGTGTQYVVSRFRLSFGSSRFHRRVALRRSRDNYHKSFFQGMDKTAEGTALSSPSEIDTRAFTWTFDSLDEDHELECFFAGLPGFRSSKVVDDPLPRLTEEDRKRLSETLIGFLDRTFSSDLLPEPVKSRRAIICAKALDPVEFPNAYGDILFQTVFQDRYRGLQTAEFGRIVRGWANSGDQRAALLVQATTSHTLTRVQRRDDSWFILASSELGVPETALRDYAAHGDSLSFAILIHIARQHFRNYWKRYWPSYAFSRVLETASKFNVQDTSPDLQHEFCALWNKIVLQVRSDNTGWMAFRTLGPIRNVYLALHQDTDSAPKQFSASTGDQDDILREPSSYPVCNVAGHFHASTPFTRTLRDSAVPLASPASAEAPSSSVPAPPFHVVESLTDVSPLDIVHAAHQTIIESLRIPVTSPYLATAGAVRDIVTSGITMPYPTPEPSTSAPASPPVAVSLQHNPDLLTPSDSPNLPSSASVQYTS